MKDSKVLKNYGYVKASNYRTSVVKTLKGENNYKTPTEISKDTNIHTHHISKVLSELWKNDIVVCVNPEVRKGRLYCLTQNGKDVSELFN